MWKKVIAASSFVTAAALTASAAYIQIDANAFTSAPDDETTRASATVAAVPEATDFTTNHIELDEMFIRGVAPRATKNARAKTKSTRVAKTTLKPCGEWLDVGARFITNDGAKGVRRARQLCR